MGRFRAGRAYGPFERASAKVKHNRLPKSLGINAGGGNRGSAASYPVTLTDPLRPLGYGLTGIRMNVRPTARQ
jgi:hypothetical protein